MGTASCLALENVFGKQFIVAHANVFEKVNTILDLTVHFFQYILTEMWARCNLCFHHQNDKVCAREVRLVCQACVVLLCLPSLLD